MANLPTGTVTFLFTDIENSTQLWEQYPEAMKAAFARHDAIMRSALENRGYIFKTVGDAFCAAFHTALDALNAALLGQRLLRDESWGEFEALRVRMGLHTGHAEIQSSGDYQGYLALARVNRLMSAGHGGQILLSQSTQELLRDHLPEGVSLKDLGDRRLKDLIRPERLYQVIALDLSQEFAPLKTLDASPNNLPVQVTSFIGREREMKEIKERLQTTHLLTLTGSGGSGKTRLSLQVSADLIDEFRNGVWFIELAPLSDASLVLPALAAVLRIREEAKRTLLEALVEYLRDKNILLILDNCEHLVEACAMLADQLIQHCPHLKILASSREALRVAGEIIYRVPSLQSPGLQPSITLESFTQYEAVRLFIDRAVAVQPRFMVNNANAPAVAQICHRLDGIPLAIELAAARVRAMSVEKIAQRLDDRFQLLTGGSRAALPRQQTLRALIDWSYDLLTESEKQLLRRLSVFVGGWTIEAAEQICANGEEASQPTHLGRVETQITSYDVLGLLISLVEKSLVVLDENKGRYRLLETVKQYVGEKLAEAGETDRLKGAHLVYFLNFAETADPKLDGAEQAEWLQRLHLEHDNLRAALGWTLQQSKAQEAQRLCGALGRFWATHGHLTEGRGWLTQALQERIAVSKEVQAKALRWAGILTWQQGDYEDTRGLFEESLAICRELGDKHGIAHALITLGLVARDLGDYQGARGLYEESLAICRELGDKHGIAHALNNLGAVARNLGDHQGARGLYEESLAIFRGLGNKRGIAYALDNLGLVALEQHNTELARLHLEQSLRLREEIGYKIGIAYGLSSMAQVLHKEGRVDAAAQLQGACMGMFEEMGVPLEPYEQKQHDNTREALKQTLGENDYQQAFEVGKGMSLEQAIALALRLPEQ